MSEIELLKRDALVVANARHIIKARKAMNNRELVKYLFGLGSTSASKRCALLGLDPDGNQTCYGAMLDHIDAADRLRYGAKPD